MQRRGRRVLLGEVARYTEKRKGAGCSDQTALFCFLVFDRPPLESRDLFFIRAIIVYYKSKN